MEHINKTINDNESKFISTSLNNVNELEVDKIADWLVEKMCNPKSRPYYCKVARLLPRNTLERFANTENEIGKHSGKLFTFLCEQEIRRKNISGRY